MQERCIKVPSRPRGDVLSRTVMFCIVKALSWSVLLRSSDTLTHIHFKMIVQGSRYITWAQSSKLTLDSES